MKNSRGFTTVEVLITLIVASLFLISGYQLYTVVIEQSADARRMSEASNIAYEIMRKEAYAVVSEPCSSPITSSPTVRANNLPKPVSATIYRCKPYTDSSIIQVRVTVRYGSTNQEVSHAIYLGD